LDKIRYAYLDAFLRAKAATAFSVLAIAILSVRPSVTRWTSQKRCKL